MKVVELMRTHIVKISPNSTIADAVDMMDLYQLTSIPVVDSNGCPLGVINDRDIAESVFGNSSIGEPTLAGHEEVRETTAINRSQSVSDIMRASSPCVDENADVNDAVRIMISNDLMRIPVTTEGKVSGTLSRIDICQAILDGQI